MNHDRSEASGAGSSPDLRRIWVSEFFRHSRIPSDMFIEKVAQNASARNIARRLGDDISEEKAILDSRLSDGSCVPAVIPPCSLQGVILAAKSLIRLGRRNHCGFRCGPAIAAGDECSFNKSRGNWLSTASE